MEEIRKFVENLIQMAGVTGGAVPVVRHILLTITAILLAMLSDLLCRRLLVPIIMKVTDKTEVTWDDVLFNKKVLTSACHIVPAVVIWSLMPLVYLEYPIFKEILERATGIYIVVMSVRTALVFIGSFKGLESSEERRSSAQQYFHTFCGVLRILMLFVAGVVVVAILLGKNPLTLFAGLGATSAVLMLVFKDTILGLAAGVRLTSNDMLHKGDWITVKSVDANGIVEEMSLTTVKVRNFDNTIVTISPATLVNGSFQNWIGMQKSGGRRVQRKVYFDFRSIRLVDEELKARLLEKHFATEDSFKPKESLQKMLAKAEVGNEHQTEMEKDQNAGLGNARQHEHQVLADLRNPAALAPTNLQLYRKYMEKYLRERPEVNTEMTLMVRQLEATQCGLPMEFYFFVKDKVWVYYEHILAEIMEHAYALSAEFGLKIYQQYPEQ
ncbi:mscS Mechanosensitive ion channel [Prevotella sp. CAG:732]|nr:mscS Mechanosensitive ion channel [Prevotella sp. CAG:732]